MCLLVVLSVAAMACAAQEQSSSTPESQEYEAPIVFRAFVNFCLSPVDAPFSHEELFKKVLIPFSEEQQGAFISVEEGTAWGPPSKEGNMVFTLHKNGMCSLHVRQVDAEEINSEYDAFVDFMTLQAGFESSDKGEKKLTATATFRHNKLVRNNDSSGSDIQLAITTDTSANSGRQALLTLVAGKEE